MATLKPKQYWLWSLRLAFLDSITLIVCGILSSELRDYGASFPHFTPQDEILIMTTCWVGLTVIGGYERKRDMCTLSYASEHFMAMGIVLLTSFFITYAFSSYNHLVKPGRSVLFLGLLLFSPLSLAYRRIFSIRARRDAAGRFIYVIGSSALASTIQKICEAAHFQYPLRFIDLEEKEKPEFDMGHVPSNKVAGLLSEPMPQCDGVVVDLSTGRLCPELEELLLNLNLHTVPVYPVDSFIETYFHKIDLPHVTLSAALDGTFNADHHSTYGKAKVLIDTCVAAILLIALLPLMAVVAFVIKAHDSGSILFKQTRIGRFDRPFLLYKFRTMKPEDPNTQTLYTDKDDPRITRVGRFLRLTRLDELPQLWNVVKGDMSIIGPRAEWNKLAEKYKKEIPFYHLRHMVKPGITGWAQVNYGYGSCVSDAYEKLQYDLYYIKHYAPEMDASIILKTLFTMISASGR